MTAATDGRYLLVKAGIYTYAIKVDQVELVCDALPITKLPLLPPYVDGMIAERGGIRLQVELKAYAQGCMVQWRESPLVCYRDESGWGVALRVDQVITMVTGLSTDPDISLSEPQQNLGKAWIGSCHYQDQIISILDLKAMEIAAVAGDNSFIVPDVSVTSHKPSQLEQRDRLMVVELNQEALAIPLTDIIEVMHLPTLRHNFHGAQMVSGFLELRELTVAVLDLGWLLGKPPCPSTIEQPQTIQPEEQALVIVHHQDFRIGLIVDRILGLENPLSTTLSDFMRGEPGISGCYQRSGALPLPIIDLTALEHIGLIEHLTEWGLSQTESNLHQQEQTHRMLFFDLGDEGCCMKLESAWRILPWKEPDPVPNSQFDHHAIEGVISVGEQVVPVGNPHKLFGLYSDGQAQAGSHIIAGAPPKLIALAVQGTPKVHAVPESAIEHHLEAQGVLGTVRREGRPHWLLSNEVLAAGANQVGESV
ncbi:chemotaxis protein CheW [Magnetococcus sp. PR-3]|uniref:chemotaxis protein CheW n=1 Tax=Magnetococcus sp. PR-3 TaxID=3120355 RepID=UPI002FCE47D9